jgi:hypothetical protein
MRKLSAGIDVAEVRHAPASEPPVIPRVRATSLTLAVVCAAAFSFWPTDAHAQRRGRRGGGRGAVIVTAPVYLGYGFYDPFWDWGYPGWGQPSPYGPPFANLGSARLQVTPRQAEVYIDGYLAGTVDDFDGVFQRLSVAPGEHELTIYLEGYRTFTQTLLFRPGTTIDIKQPLVPLGPGEASGPRPQASAPPAGPPDPGGRPGPGSGPQPAVFGTLAIRVQPDGATLFVDGEEWSAPDDDGRILIDLADGPHDVEVRKDGLTTYRRTVQVRAGRTVRLNVSLSR